MVSGPVAEGDGYSRGLAFGKRGGGDEGAVQRELDQSN